MSEFMVVHEVSQALRDLLWRDFQNTSTIKDLVGPIENVVFANPTDTAREAANRLSIWLHQISENEFVKNQPPVRLNGGSAEIPPLALDLFYLVTPFVGTGSSEQNNHMLLGRVMQVFYDNATILLRRDDPRVAEELRIVFCKLSLEELTRIWEALQEPYRLSVCYRVSVTRIDSLRETTAEAIRTRTADYGPAPFGSGS